LKIYRKSRIEELVDFDKRHGNFIIGTDEAGRGPLAGPVVASAVFFPEFNDEVLETIKFIDDSKKFSSNPKLRKELAEQIKKVVKYSIFECSVEEIEKYNILHASLLAMKKACDDLFYQITDVSEEITILIDGNFIISGYKKPQKAVKKGDSMSASIAAASILAKVYRDELMAELSKEFPVYEWHKNKGYPTAAHIEAIKTYGSCKWHRKTFLWKIISEQKKINI